MTAEKVFIMSQVIQKIVLICAKDSRGTLFLLHQKSEKYPSFLHASESAESFTDTLRDKLQNHFNIQSNKNSLKRQENFVEKILIEGKSLSCELYLLQEDKEKLLLKTKEASWLLFPELFKNVLKKDQARRTYLRIWQVLMGPE